MTEPDNSDDVIPAATLIVMREQEDDAPEILMVERAGVMAFAPGAAVFPGGRVDPGDLALAEALGLADLSEGAARIAAIRETIEEAGLPIGVSTTHNAKAPADLRALLRDGVPFADALAAAEATLALEALTPFARWCPAQRLVRRFDARFYLASLPDDAPEAVVDSTENTRLFWTTARAVLAEAAAGRSTLVFPTWCNLKRLALFDSYAAAIAQALTYPPRLIVPWIERRDGEDYLCIPDDLGYPVSSALLGNARRR